jgi:hypothetical protein
MIELDRKTLIFILTQEIHMADYDPILKAVFEAIFTDAQCTLLDNGEYAITGDADVLDLIKNNGGI